MEVVKREGVLSLFRGNGFQVVRVAPYAAISFSANDYFLSVLAGPAGGS